MNRGVREIFVDDIGEGKRDVSWLYFCVFGFESCICRVDWIGIEGYWWFWYICSFYILVIGWVEFFWVN